MKKSTWKKLFTRSKSKSSTRTAKKGKPSSVACNVCAGVAVINFDTLCSAHRNNQNRNQADTSPQGAVSTGQTHPSSLPLASSLKKTAQVNEKAAEPAAAVSQAQEDQKVNESGLEKSAPVEIPKPQPLARSSTNDEFMTEEVESHNLSDNSRTDENLEAVNEAEGNKAERTPSPNELKVPSGTQELKKSSEEMRAPSGTHGLRIRRSGTQVRESASESQGFNVQTQTLENQITAESLEHETSSEAQESPSSQPGLVMPSSTADEREVEVATLNLKVDSVVDKSFVGTQEEQNVEAKNRKNVLSIADVDLNSIVHGLPSQPRRESQSSGRQVETTSSSNNEEFMSEEVTIGSGASAEGEDAYYLKSPPQEVSSATTIAKHDTSSSSHQESNISSNQGLQIVEVDEQEAAPHGSRRLSMDATNMSKFSSNKSPSLVKGVSNESEEDLKPGVLQAQRSSKLNISFSEHVSLLGDTKGNEEATSHDSLESSENTTEVTIIETTTIITAGTTDRPFNLGIPSGAQHLKTSSGTESEEALLPPPEDDDPTLEGDSGMGSDESSTSGPKETAEETSIQQNTANNGRPTPTIIFGTISGPEQENEWSQPLFFGPNALAQGLTLNVNRDRERENSRGSEGQAPFQGFGIISIMRDLYENDSSASQVQETKVTEVTEEKKKEAETEESGQAPPSLDDEEQENESFKEVAKKQE